MIVVRLEELVRLRIHMVRRKARDLKQCNNIIMILILILIANNKNNNNNNNNKNNNNKIHSI